MLSSKLRKSGVVLGQTKSVYPFIPHALRPFAIGNDSIDSEEGPKQTQGYYKRKMTYTSASSSE
jgi:hypothetical protein